MANKNDRSRGINKANKNISKLAGSVKDNMDYLYRSTYMSSPQQNDDIKRISADINKNLDKIVNKNMELFGKPNMSNLYSRMALSGNNSSEDELVKDISQMFDTAAMTDDLYNTFMNNKYLKELDQEIDTICKYMPKLEEALAVQKDCVLSADHFSKNFLSFQKISASTTSEVTFSERCKRMETRYKLAELTDAMYDDIAKYGECFVYRVPYNIAIGKLLASKQASEELPINTIKEAEIDTDSSSMNEHYLFSLNKNKCVIKDERRTETVLESAVSSRDNTVMESLCHLHNDESFNIGVEICTKGIIESAIKDKYNAIHNKTSNVKSLASIYENSINEANDKFELNGDIDLVNRKKNSNYVVANDGLISGAEQKPVDVKTTGCVVKRCPREMVYPIYIEDMCMGYYYFEISDPSLDGESFMGFKSIFSDALSNSRNGNMINGVDAVRRDETLKYVANQLSRFIDKKFVNANQDLSREIYMILKYNDQFNISNVNNFKVTFIPPEDMVHFYFNQDPITHRGISDLEKGLIPAKIYASLYITTSIGNLTRSIDKRVYYVKQTADKNIAGCLLNVINQIKQSNFNIRQFQSINNILNITGRYNDYVIPTNASGDAPIQFEVMQGQEIQTPTDLMQALEEAAINSTGIPIEIIQSRQSVDYAMQLTMSSSKVLRFCYKRQELYEHLLSELITPIYNYEYSENERLKVTLPPPSFINVTNTNQLITNTKEFVQNIVEMKMAGNEDEKLKNAYTNKLFEYYIGTHLDTAKHQELYDKSVLEVNAEKNESHSDENDNDSGY